MSAPYALIVAQELNKTFGAAHVVQNVSLNIPAGNIVTVIGPNGSGKTTLIRMLLALEVPDSGTITRKPGLKIGYMPQRLAIDPILPLTVRWLLALSAGKNEAAIPAIAEEVGITHLLGSRLQSVSGGEFQRVLLARALLCEPDLLVLDEPAQGVDVAGQALFYDLISKVSRQRKAAVLMVSHDLHLVMSSTDHVLCINHHVCCSGHPHSVKGDPAFIDLFGKHVAASLAVYTHHHDHEHS